MASGGVVFRKYFPTVPPSRMHFYKFSTNTCTYKGYKCQQYCVEGYQYCIRHILEDDSAPFQQCSFTYSFTMKRCPQAAPKCDFAESVCPDHLHKMQRTRNRAGKSQPALSVEKLLSSLGHFVKPAQSAHSSKNSGDSESGPLNPFVDIDANAVNSALSNVLDYCSESDSDVDSSIIARTARCKDEESSDAESADSAGEDIFKFASVLTADEALQRAREKTQRLKTLYTEQLKRLTHVLHERRRDYLIAIQKEKESLCSIAEQSTGSVRELKLAEKIKSYNHYRKFYGVEAILRKKMKNKRKGLALDSQTVRPGCSKCVFTEGGVKCSVKTLPNAKFCPKHILNDPFQVLFRPCGFIAEDNTCREPLPGMEPCIYHMGMVPAQISYNTALSSEEEEDVKEESIDVKTPAPDVTQAPDMVLQENEIKLEDGEILDDVTKMEFVDPETFGFEEEIVVCDDNV